jgi:hypothetical protein
MFGYFTSRDFDPETWVNEYPNPAFSRMTERDGAWMARILAGFTPELVQRLARLGRLSNDANTEYLARTLEERLMAILGRYLTRLSPIGRVKAEGDTLCGVDLAEARGVRPPSAFAYRARMAGGDLAVTRGQGGGICVVVPHDPPVANEVPLDAPERYRTVTFEDGVARGPLVAHLYDGGKEGFRLVGVERPESPVEAR